MGPPTLNQLSYNRLDQLTKVIDPNEIKRHSHLRWSRLALSFNPGLSLTFMIWTLNQTNFRHGWYRLGLARIGLLTQWDELGYGRYSHCSPEEECRVRRLLTVRPPRPVVVEPVIDLEEIKLQLETRSRTTLTITMNPQTIIDHPELNWAWELVPYHRNLTSQLFDLWLSQGARIPEITNSNQPRREGQSLPLTRDQTIARAGFPSHLQHRTTWPAEFLMLNRNVDPRFILTHTDPSEMANVAKQRWHWIWSMGTPQDYLDYPRYPWKYRQIFGTTTMGRLYRCKGWERNEGSKGTHVSAAIEGLGKRPAERSDEDSKRTRGSTAIEWRCITRVPGLRLAEIERLGFLLPIPIPIQPIYHDVIVYS